MWGLRMRKGQPPRATQGAELDLYKPLFIKIITKEGSGLTTPTFHKEPNTRHCHRGSGLPRSKSRTLSTNEQPTAGTRALSVQGKGVQQFVLTDGSHTPYFVSFCSSSLFPNSFIRSFPCPYRYHTYQLSSTWTPEVSYVRTQTLRAALTSANVVSPPHPRLFSDSFSTKQPWTTRMPIQLLL